MFELSYWAIHRAHLGAFSYLIWSIWGCLNGYKQHKKLFSSCLGPFILNDWVRGLFLSLDIESNILPAWGPSCTFLGPFEGTQMATKRPKTA